MRIIAGSAKGRRFEAPEGQDTRPTLDRVKEALFGSIQFDLPGKTVLDLFSGSGNLGLEAVSRGARMAVLNDASPNCANLIRSNAESTKLQDAVAVWQSDYIEAIARAARQSLRFDIVFIDAPYHKGLAEDAAKRLFLEGLIRPEGFVIVEHARDNPPAAAPGVMEIAWTRLYGACGLTKLKGETPNADLRIPGQL